VRTEDDEKPGVFNHKFGIVLKELNEAEVCLPRRSLNRKAQTAD